MVDQIADGDAGAPADLDFNDLFAAAPPLQQVAGSPGSPRPGIVRQRSVTFDETRGSARAKPPASAAMGLHPLNDNGESAEGIDEAAVPRLRNQLSASMDAHELQQLAAHARVLHDFHGSERALLRRQASRPDAAAAVAARARLDSEDSLGVRVAPEDFELLKVVGQGAYGRVFQVRHTETGRILAMKALSKGHILEKNNLSYVLEERNILSKTSHPFVVKLLCAFQTPRKLYLVMEYVSGGELFSHLRDEGLFAESQARFYAAEMVLALEYLHQHGIIHRDLKPENVLLDSRGHLRITDFGLATENRQEARTLCGTDLYMAPEMIAGTGYGKAVDFWSLGAIVFEMLTGDTPFYAKDTRRLYRLILTSKPRFPRWLSRECIALLKGLLNRNVEQRLGAAASTMFKVGGVQALKAHDFFADVDWNALERLEVDPPFAPPAHDGELDTSNFSEIFTKLLPEDVHNEPDSDKGAELLQGASEADFAGFSFTHPSYLSAALVASAIGSPRGDCAVAAVVEDAAGEDAGAGDGDGDACAELVNGDGDACADARANACAGPCAGAAQLPADDNDGGEVGAPALPAPAPALQELSPLGRPQSCAPAAAPARGLNPAAREWTPPWMQ